MISEKAIVLDIRPSLTRWLPATYICCMTGIVLGLAQFDPYQVDGDAVSYMDIAGSIVHGRWKEIVNGLWNPGYPAVLALGKIVAQPNRMHALELVYRTNFCIFLFSIFCTWFFVGSVLRVREGGKLPTEVYHWALSARLLYLVSYATVCLSWMNEFSPGKVRVDGLFASLLLLAFAFLLRGLVEPRFIFDVGFGFALGAAYLVKSPGFVIALFTFVLVAIYASIHRQFKYRPRRLLISALIYIAVAGPYITALSLQKGRFDFGDSGRLNYAWLVDGTQPQHLLNGQPARFGAASVLLKHPAIEILRHPIVLYFPHFPHATYGPWFDPSYFNEGVHPHIYLARQLRLTVQQLRRLLFFLVIHALPIAFLVFSLVCGAKTRSMGITRGALWLLYLVLLFSIAMYLSVHFLDRYVGGQFWLAWIATAGFLIVNDSQKKYMMQGAAVFLAVAVLLMGLQSVIKDRQSVILNGLGHGWYNPAEYETVAVLRAHGILPGDAVACFRACNHGSYWAYLAGVHVNSEIYDPAFMSDAKSGNEIWSNLPAKQQVFQALSAIGAKALVGYFEDMPPSGEKWTKAAGGYYIISLPLNSASPGPLRSH